MSETAPLIDKLFQAMVKLGASDLHLSVGSAPMVRKDGHMQLLDSSLGVLSGQDVVQMLAPIMPAVLMNCRRFIIGLVLVVRRDVGRKNSSAANENVRHGRESSPDTASSRRGG